MQNWQGLTEDELQNLYYNGNFWVQPFGGDVGPGRFDWEAFGRAVERILREKNEVANGSN